MSLILNIFKWIVIFLGIIMLTVFITFTASVVYEMVVTPESQNLPYSEDYILWTDAETPEQLEQFAKIETLINNTPEEYLQYVSGIYYLTQYKDYELDYEGCDYNFDVGYSEYPDAHGITVFTNYCGTRIFILENQRNHLWVSDYLKELIGRKKIKIEDTTEWTYWHEIAHAIYYNTFDYNKTQELKDDFTKVTFFPTEYSKTDYFEYHAEMFAYEQI